MSNRKLNKLIAKTVSNFAEKSEKHDNDVNSNMMLLALTVTGILKDADPDAFECYCQQFAERHSDMSVYVK